MQLNTAQKWCVKRGRGPKSQIIRPLLNPDSPNVARTSPPTSLQLHRIWRHKLLPVGCKLPLNTACKCVKGDQPAMGRIIRPMFNVESPNFTMPSMPTESTETLDTTSSDTSGWYLSKFQKTAEHAGNGSNFSGAAFFLPHQLVGVLFYPTAVYLWRWNIRLTCYSWNW